MLSPPRLFLASLSRRRKGVRLIRAHTDGCGFWHHGSLNERSWPGLLERRRVVSRYLLGHSLAACREAIMLSIIVSPASECRRRIIARPRHPSLRLAPLVTTAATTADMSS